MQSNDGEPVQIVPADLGKPAQAAGLLACLEAYARDPMGGGVPLPGDVSARLIAGLKTAPYRIWLAEAAGQIVGAAVCFDSYSTFRAQPRLNLHDLVVQPAWRRRGIGRQLLLAVIEHAPFGVIGAVTPVTHSLPTATGNAISMIAAGNTVVFAPHPAAKRVSQLAVTRINEAVVAAGGPDNVVVTVAEPNIETAQKLFRYPGINLLVVTGGEAVVNEARKHTDKRLIAAGAGNPPVVVDETADIPRAARDIVYGASFDNNIICADEKEIIVVDCVADQLKAEMKKNKAVELTRAQADQLLPILLSKISPDGHGSVSRDWVGRDAAKIAAAIGLDVPADTRLLFVETEANHPFAVSELMMPVVPVIRAANANEAIDLAVKLEGGCRHTAAMHSTNLDNLDRMANAINTSIFVKNGPCIAGLGFGGEGWTSMTISTPTGEGVTHAASFVRLRRCVLVDHFRIV